MDQFFILLRDFYTSIINLLASTGLQWGSLRISYFRVVVCFLIIGFVANLFWKGVRA